MHDRRSHPMHEPLSPCGRRVGEREPAQRQGLAPCQRRRPLSPALSREGRGSNSLVRPLLAASAASKA